MSSEVPPRYHLLGGLGYLFATYALLLAIDETGWETTQPWVLKLAGKEQLIELLGALFLLAASVTYFASFWAKGRNLVARRRRLSLLLLGLLFLVAFGEEVSWGQHLFGFQTPDTLRRYNVQGELNLHNLQPLDTFTHEGQKKTGLSRLLNSNRLFDYFMIAFFLLAPLLAANWPQMRALLERHCVPRLPTAFGALLLANLLATAIAELFLVRENYFLHIAVSEIRESNYALLCFLASVYSLSCHIRRSGECSASLG